MIDCTVLLSVCLSVCLPGRYVYVAIIYNFCYSWALFWMLLFYVGTEELLHVSAVACKQLGTLATQLPCGAISS